MSEEIQAQARELAAALKMHGKEIEKARKALDDLAEGTAFRNATSRKRARKAIQDCAGQGLPDLSGFLGQLDQAAKAYKQEQRLSFVDALLQEAAKESLPTRKLGDQPPVYDLGGMACTLDFEKEEAELSYARESMARLPLDPVRILEAREERLEKLTESWPGKEAFFEATWSAYRGRLGREGSAPGERIHLVDLIPELTLEYAERKLWQGQKSEGLRTMTRLDLAFCLDRLAHEGGLQHGNLRLELGTATGGSTKDKKKVLFLEAGMGGGQYYLSLRFSQQPGGGR